jgi:hypothetical protein
LQKNFRILAETGSALILAVTIRLQVQGKEKIMIQKRDCDFNHFEAVIQKGDCNSTQAVLVLGQQIYRLFPIFPQIFLSLSGLLLFGLASGDAM